MAMIAIVPPEPDDDAEVVSIEGCVVEPPAVELGPLVVELAMVVLDVGDGDVVELDPGVVVVGDDVVGGVGAATTSSCAELDHSTFSPVL